MINKILPKKRKKKMRDILRIWIHVNKPLRMLVWIQELNYTKTHVMNFQKKGGKRNPKVDNVARVFLVYLLEKAFKGKHQGCPL